MNDEVVARTKEVFNHPAAHLADAHKTAADHDSERVLYFCTVADEE